MRLGIDVVYYDEGTATGYRRRLAEALSAFDGEDAQGTWTLYVEDFRTGAEGSLAYWALRLR